MKEKLLFFKKYLRQSRHIGAVVPSSRFLAKAVCKNAGLKEAQVVVELGGGTGVLSEQIVRQIPQNCDLVIVERDNEFARMLQTKFNGSHVWVTEAQHMHEYLDQHQFKSVDCFISGLPFVSLPKEVSHEIMKIIQNYLAPDGVLVAYSYFMNTYFFFKKYFPSVKIDYEIRNIPPAFVYTCRLGKSSSNGSELQADSLNVNLK